MQKTVLVVDPDQCRLSGIASYWHDQPWKTITTNTLEEAIDILDDMVVDMIIATDDLGWLSGSEFLRLTHHRYPRMIRILITQEQLISTIKPHSLCFHAEDHFHLVTSKQYDTKFMTQVVQEMFGMEICSFQRVSGNLQVQ